jgi:putative transposase
LSTLQCQSITFCFCSLLVQFCIQFVTMLAVTVHSASVQDRDGAEALLQEARRTFPFVERIIGDAGYQGRKMEAAVARTGTWTLQIVRRCDRHSFVVLPKRWIVESVGKPG